MKPIEKICRKYNIALCYLFGSQKKIGQRILENKKVKMLDGNSDIDFGILFQILPYDLLETYARLSLEFL